MNNEHFYDVQIKWCAFAMCPHTFELCPYIAFDKTDEESSSIEDFTTPI